MSGENVLGAPAAGRLVVDADGRLASWAPGVGFTGDADVVAAAQEAVRGSYVFAWGDLDPQAASGRGAARAPLPSRSGLGVVEHRSEPL